MSMTKICSQYLSSYKEIACIGSKTQAAICSRYSASYQSKVSITLRLDTISLHGAKLASQEERLSLTKMSCQKIDLTAYFRLGSSRQRIKEYSSAQFSQKNCFHKLSEIRQQAKCCFTGVLLLLVAGKMICADKTNKNASIKSLADSSVAEKQDIETAKSLPMQTVSLHAKELARNRLPNFNKQFDIYNGNIATRTNTLKSQPAPQTTNINQGAKAVADSVTNLLKLDKAPVQTIALGPQELGRKTLPSNEKKLAVANLNLAQRSNTVHATPAPAAANLNEAAKAVADALANAVKIDKSAPAIA